ncbi:MAG: glycosyltransferase family 2 protein [Thermoproteus sp. AZ2]|jgi:dolichol-phosphate mannosyltransferase|uniref:Glycosyltransferase family 2 protein n=1 Tax=Thermoproteus sp. AZ2 TaxID=1609232 RepID=A0ACC6UZD1_9CREN
MEEGVDMEKGGEVDYAVIIPTLNECEGIGKVIEEALSAGVPREAILVVDGGSADCTIDEAAKRGVKVIKQRGRGKADAIKTGVEAVDKPVVVVIDGDFTYPAYRIPQLVKALAESRAVEVIGARKYIEPGAQSAIYSFGNKALSWWFNLLMGTRLSDVLSGFYAIRRDAVVDAAGVARGFSIEVELAANAASAGEVVEVPVEYRRRLGKKKLGVRHGLEIAWSSFKLAWYYNPLFVIAALGALLLFPGLGIAGWVLFMYALRHVEHWVWGIISIVMVSTGLQFLALGAVALYLKRMERRLRILLTG